MDKTNMKLNTKTSRYECSFEEKTFCKSVKKQIRDIIGSDYKSVYLKNSFFNGANIYVDGKLIAIYTIDMRTNKNKFVIF